ncbi:MAG: hypothetical protein AAGD25_17420 [Cyanobacteria bacterium P01_F01_bin.150]
MERESDEDKLIAVLKRHRDLKRWVMSELHRHGIDCQETYGNDEKGDIKLLNLADTQKAQDIIDGIHQRFNPTSQFIQQSQHNPTDSPHIEIKTQYLYGQEAMTLIAQGTVVGIASANAISQPSQLKLKQSGITFAEHISASIFSSS